MEDQIIYLVVSVDKVSPVLRLQFLVTEKGQHLVNMRYLSDRDLRFYVHCCGLSPRDCREGFYLAIVEAGWFAIVFQPNVFGIDAVEPGQCSNSIVPPVSDLSNESTTVDVLVPTFLSFRQV
jgi:hypothetical protein